MEAHYTYNPRLIAIGKYELIRMSRQANPTIRGNSGNLDTWTIGYRWYPIMNPRAGLAWVQEEWDWSKVAGRLGKVLG